MHSKLAFHVKQLENAKQELAIQLAEVRSTCEHKLVYAAPFDRGRSLGCLLPTRICEECRLEDHAIYTHGVFRHLNDKEGRAVEPITREALYDKRID